MASLSWPQSGDSNGRSRSVRPAVAVATLLLFVSGCLGSSTPRSPPKPDLTVASDAILMTGPAVARFVMVVRNPTPTELVVDQFVVQEMTYDGMTWRSKCKKGLTLATPATSVKIAGGSEHAFSLDCPVAVSALDPGTRNPLTERAPFAWSAKVQGTFHEVSGTRVIAFKLRGVKARLVLE